MPRARKLTDEQTQELVRMCNKGFANKDIAKHFGIGESTVGTYYRRARRERTRSDGQRIVVERKDALLVFDTMRLTYVGTCKFDGEEQGLEETFKAIDDTDAMSQFDAWLKAEREAWEYAVECAREPEPEPELEPEPEPEPEPVLEEMPMPEPSMDELYVIYVDGGRPKNWFTSLDDAIRAMDQLNSALEFAGATQRYAVEMVDRWCA